MGQQWAVTPSSRVTAYQNNPITPSFASFARQWQQEKQVEWRASHARNVASVLESSLIKTFGDQPISEIAKADILDFRSKLAATPGRGDSDLISPKTVNTHMQLLKSILEEASDRLALTIPIRILSPYVCGDHM